MPHRIPVRDFFRNPDRWLCRISPDGKVISFLRPWQRRLNIFVQTGPSGTPRRVTSEKDSDITEYFWKGSRYLLYPMGADVFRVDLEEDSVLPLTGFKNASVGLVDSLE